jgi:hypothetical protein
MFCKSTFTISTTFENSCFSDECYTVRNSFWTILFCAFLFYIDSLTYNLCCVENDTMHKNKCSVKYFAFIWSPRSTPGSKRKITPARGTCSTVWRKEKLGFIIKFIAHIMTLYVESVQIPSVGVISLFLIFVVIFHSPSFSLMLGYLSMCFICNRCDWWYEE